MDPNLFAIDIERLGEVLLSIIVLAFFIERALALLFEQRWVADRISGKGIKEPVTLAVSYLVCKHWDFDAISVIFLRDQTHFWGHLLTAGVVAGGSKASVKLFHDVLGVMSAAERKRQGLGKARTEGGVAQAQAAE
ncbi:MAG TPA: hypothetical protein VNN80_05335 [Polyangiaceae bacterium]|nr:hypothetical protein [Polyangiaceae bacterium]